VQTRRGHKESHCSDFRFVRDIPLDASLFKVSADSGTTQSGATGISFDGETKNSTAVVPESISISQNEYLSMDQRILVDSDVAEAVRNAQKKNLRIRATFHWREREKGVKEAHGRTSSPLSPSGNQSTISPASDAQVRNASTIQL
jgi:hypothetical protein